MIRTVGRLLVRPVAKKKEKNMIVEQRETNWRKKPKFGPLPVRTCGKRHHMGEPAKARIKVIERTARSWKGRR